MVIARKCTIFTVTFSLLFIWINGSNHVDRQPYIVYMGDPPKFRMTAVHNHNMLLTTAIGDEKLATDLRIHSYGRSFNAFAAKLFPEEVEKLKNMEGVVSVFPNTVLKLHTTRSWDFIGLTQTVKRETQNESNMIVGFLDSGIYVDSPSFDDKGYGPPPAKWKGTCAKGANFTGCNNKVIGARYYKLGDAYSNSTGTPADTEGHGTHTSSTVAGSPINDANFYGLAKGTARGGVPSARIAMYKVCWPSGCTSMDLLAGFDDAIDDGVDVISISIGGPAGDYFSDPIAIGAFHAIKKGILTVCSGGNDGPSPNSITNVAPWILTVAASGMDRQFRTEVELGNGKKIYGLSVNTFSPEKTMYPLITGAQASNNSDDIFGSSSSCESGTLDKKKVKGKIVYCIPETEGGGGGGRDYSVKQAGGVGVIVESFDKMDTAFTFVLPAAYVNDKDGGMINRYINTTTNAQAVIRKTATVTASAPFVASFSSRGPNSVSTDILKPDITAPGVDILAAWSRLASVTTYDIDNRIVNLNIISGTSMACPHVAAVAAYVKSFHPHWSPAAIRSAIMTTATEMKINKNDTEFGYGSGQVDPVRAVNPGLVYDLATNSYVSFLCKEGYNGTTLGRIMGSAYVNCSKYPQAQGSDGLNYPSMQLHVSDPNERISATFYRTLTNVEHAKSVYKATVQSTEGLSISVQPNTLTFSRVGERKSFKVVVKGKPLGTTSSTVLSAAIEWSDKSKHKVRSPLVVYQANSMDHVG